MKTTFIFRAVTLLTVLQGAALLGIATAASDSENFLENASAERGSEATSPPIDEVSRPGKGAGPRLEPIMTVEITLGSRVGLDRLTGAGYDVTSVHGNRAVLRADVEELEHLRAEGWDLRLVEPARRLTEGFSLQGLGEYHTYTNLTAMLDDYAVAYPSLCRMISLGKSVQGRDLWALKISDNPDLEEDEPEVKLVATMHGSEPVGTEMSLYLIDLLLKGYSTNDVRLVNLVDNLEIWFVPMMNPDGRQIRRLENASGVNLNRGFPNGAVGSQWLGNRVYGPPISTNRLQPEVRHMMTWSEAHSFALAVNFHGGTVVVCYPYDDDGLGSVSSPTPDDALCRALARTYATNNPAMKGSFSAGGIINGAAWYVASGTMADWNYRYEGCVDLTLELSEDYPPASRLPNLWSQNQESLLAYLEWALRGVRGIVRDAQTGQPVYAAVRVEGIHHLVFSDPDVGDYHRLLLPGTYTLWFCAPGYIARKIPGVIVTDGAATRLDIALQPVSPRFAAKINFQPANTNVPTGFLADSGAAFGPREGGYTSGWDTDLATTSLVARKAGRSQDLRYDTFCQMQAGGNHVWEIAVPNGPYSVLVGAGDPSTRTNRYQIYAEDDLLLDGAVLLTNKWDCNRWVESLGTVIVTDERLTLSSGPEATNDFLAFVEISAVEPATIEQWRAFYFATTNNAGTATDNADPDRDGLPNLVEYAFGLNPTQPDPETQLVPVVVWQDSVAWFACEFPRDTNASDLTFRIEATSDLTIPVWSEVASYRSGIGWSGPGKVVETPTSPNRARVTALDLQPISSRGSRFVRLQVASP